MQHRYPYVVIEGNIGAGKTTLVNRLAQETQSRVMLEQFADNSFLPRFYNDARRYAFPLELSFMASRFNQLKELIGTGTDMFTSSQLIADYSFFKNLVFARITLDEDEFKLFYKLYEIMTPQLPRPDLVVYLHQPVNRLVANISKRGRNYEKDIKPSYLEKIDEGYLSYFKQAPGLRVLVLNAKELDFVSSDADFEWVKEKIFDTDYPMGISRPVI